MIQYKLKIILYAIVLLIVVCCSNVRNVVLSIPISTAGIIGEFESVAIDSKEINKLLDQTSTTINLYRYYYLNKFNSNGDGSGSGGNGQRDNLMGNVKYIHPIFELSIVEGKLQKQFLSLDGIKDNLKQPKYNNRGQQIGYNDFQIGTLYDLTIHVDTTIQQSKNYESFLRNQSTTNIIEDYKSKRILESKCRYIQIKLYKDYQKLVLIKQFICIDKLDDHHNNGNGNGNGGDITSTITSTNSKQYKQPQYTGDNGDDKLKVMSYNTWNFNEPWRERRVNMADVIEKEQPDIISFQELRFSAWTSENKQTNFIKMGEERNQAQQLYKLLGERNLKYHFVYQPSMVYPTNTGLQFEGLAIFSKYPITKSTFIKLSRDIKITDDVHQRTCLGVEIYLPHADLRVNVFTSHFSLEPDGSKRNAFESFEFISSFPKPHLFMGDLNLEPNELPIQFLIGNSQINNQVGNLIDTWVEFKNSKQQHQQQQVLRDGGDDGCESTDLINGFTFPTLQGSPNKRIDYLFRSQDSILSTIDFKIVGKCSKLSKFNQQIYPSDHTSIITTFKINNK